MKARKIRVIVAGFAAAMAVSAAAPVMADELTSTPAVYAMSSTVRTIINGQEYTRETAYSSIRYYFDYNFNPDNYNDLEKMMDTL